MYRKFQEYNIVFHNFKGYSSLILIIKYWLRASVLITSFFMCQPFKGWDIVVNQMNRPHAHRAYILDLEKNSNIQHVE